jgi:hypothetical protein
MKLFNLYFPRDTGFEIMSELGSLASLQFQDLSAESKFAQKPYLQELLTIEEMISQLSQIEKQLRPFSVQKINPFVSEEEMEQIVNQTKQKMKQITISEFFHESKQNISSVKKTCEDFYKAVKSIQYKINIGVQKEGLLEEFGSFFKTQMVQSNKTMSRLNEFKENGWEESIQINSCVGVIPNLDLNMFKKAVFRLTRGNVLSEYRQLKKLPEGKRVIGKSLRDLIWVNGAI